VEFGAIFGRRGTFPLGTWQCAGSPTGAVRAGRWAGPRQRAWRQQGPIYLAAAERRTDGWVREDSRGLESRVNGRVARADADQTVDTASPRLRLIERLAGSQATWTRYPFAVLAQFRR
jgi:hypothetical protein